MRFFWNSVLQNYWEFRRNIYCNNIIFTLNSRWQVDNFSYLLVSNFEQPTVKCFYEEPLLIYCLINSKQLLPKVERFPVFFFHDYLHFEGCLKN